MATARVPPAFSGFLRTDAHRDGPVDAEPFCNGGHVLLLFPHYEQDDVTYFSYHKPGISPAETADVK